jgi:hypothetical protein
MLEHLFHLLILEATALEQPLNLLLNIYVLKKLLFVLTPIVELVPVSTWNWMRKNFQIFLVG